MSSDRPMADPGPRALTDPRAMRALAHPIRLALVELLSIEGPQTATQASDAVGESPSSCSFHLRQLAKYGFVEETGTGRGRQRPWRMTAIGTTLADTHQDAEASVAASALSDMYAGRIIERFQRWRANRRLYPQVWQDAAGWFETVWWLTPSELTELNEKLLGLVDTYRERLVDPATRPDGAEPIEMFAVTFPVRPPAPPRKSATAGSG